MSAYRQLDDTRNITMGIICIVERDKCAFCAGQSKDVVGIRSCDGLFRRHSWT
jgi:hypothetical protein